MFINFTCFNLICQRITVPNTDVIPITSNIENNIYLIMMENQLEGSEGKI